MLTPEIIPDIIPEPFDVDPTRIIENLHPTQGPFVVPDDESRSGFEQYLIERHNPVIGTVLVQDGEEVRVTEMTRVRRSLEDRGWLIHPGFTAAGIIIGVVAPNILPNVPSAVVDSSEELDRAADWVHDLIWEDTKTITVTVPRLETQTIVVERPLPTQEVTITRSVTQEKPNESAAFDEAARDLAQEIIGYVNDKSCELTGGSVVATASDDVRRSIESLGRVDQYNIDLALLRGTDYMKVLEEELAKAGITISSFMPLETYEAIMGSGSITSLQGRVESFGYQDVDQVLTIYNTDPESLPQSLRAILDIELGDKRGVRAVAELTCNGTETTQVEIIVPRIVTTEEPREIPFDNDPPDNNHDYDFEFWPIIIPPIRKYGINRTLETKTSVERIRSTERLIPEEVIVKLYPDVLEDLVVKNEREFELSNDTWFWTRKYQALLREDRVKEFLRYDYLAGDGTTKSFHMMFVDHEPTSETLASFTELMQKFAMINDGEMPDKLGMIAVFPSDQAGVKPNSPKTIGLGIDEQYPEGVMGVAIPALGLVEMHMPKKPSKEELDGFNGASWVFAHEVGGHFSDIKNEPITMKRHKRNALNFSVSDAWQDKATGVFKQFNRTRLSPARWFTRMTLIDKNDETRTIESDNVASSHTSVGLSRFKRKWGFPTNYSATKAGELYAEGAAAELTQIGIPDAESGENIAHQVGFSDSYAIDQALHTKYGEWFGADTEGDFVGWPMSQIIQTEPVVTKGEMSIDEDMRRRATRARTTRLPLDTELVRIVTTAQAVGKK